MSPIKDTVQYFEWLVSLRYSRARRGNGFISFISLISVAGIMLGVAALIIVLSVMNGFQEEMRTRILGATSHLEVSSYDGLVNWANLAQQLEKQPEIIASAPYVLGQALINTGENATGVMVRGIMPTTEARVSEFDTHMRQGHMNNLIAGEFNIVLGANLAAQLEVNVGDKITLITPQGQITPAGVLPRIKQFTVVGIFQLDAYQYDTGLALIHLHDAQILYRLADHISGLRLKLTNLFQAPRVAQALSQQFPTYRFIDWTQQHAQYFRAIQIEKRMMFIILTLIIAVAAFNLVSTLVMSVTDKQADIAILRTLGASSRSIMRIFMLQGAFSGLIGTLLGTGIGVAVAMHIDIIIPALENALGTRFLSPEIYQITELPSKVIWSDVGTIAGIAVILSFLATLYPSWRAARIQPAAALRYE